MSKDNIENNTEEQEEMTSENQNTEETNSNEEVELSELEKKEIEYRELNDKYIRLFSEFDNYRKRTAKEKLDLIATAGGDIIKEMLPILDDFERAMSTNQEVQDIDAIKEGFTLIHNKLIHNLTNKGLKPMDSMHEEFDVNKHEALTQIPAPSEDLKGKVVDVIEKGYVLNDKVIRFAKVVVGQ